MFNFLISLLIQTSQADIGYSFDSYLYLQKNQPADSIINPSNQIFKSPDLESTIDLRAELKWKGSDKLAVIRPRLTGYYRSIESNNQIENESKGQIDLTDAFYEHNWTSIFSSTVGLQVYQWGPAEFINASNSLFHFNPRQKSVVYKEKGQVLMRANLTMNKENSLVFIIEPVSNNEAEWIVEDPFSPKALLKYEKSWSNTANYLGFVIGSEEKNNFYLGEYFNFSPMDGFSLYADMKQAQNRINFIPEISGNNVNLVPEAQAKSQWPWLGAFGVRWEDNYDVRFEYIYNGMGLGKSDLNLAISSAAGFANPNYSQNLRRFLKPGLELLGQNYLYASYRINEPFKFKELNVYLRYVQSLQDDSGQLQFEFDKSLFESFQIFSNVSFVNGSLDTEFRLINDWQALMGIKWGI